jgi:hypothetical protein
MSPKGRGPDSLNVFEQLRQRKRWLPWRVFPNRLHSVWQLWQVILALPSSGQQSQNDSGLPNPVLGSYPRTFSVSGCTRLRGG